MTPARAVALALLAAALPAAPAPALGASFTLTPAERAAALDVGRRSTTKEGFDAEWRVVNAAGDSVTVVTPFHRLAIAARHAAFRNERMKAREPERLLREQRDRLVIWAHLRGPREDFARFLAPRLILGEREIEAAFVQNEYTAAPRADGTYVARCFYGFPIRDLSGDSRVLLVVRDPDGREVSRFTIDLGAMR